MNKKVIKVLVILIILSAVVGFIIFKSQSKEEYINKKSVKIRYEDILNLSESEKDKCIEGLIKYLNDNYFYVCNRIEFYNNSFDESNNEKYFYALAIGQDKSLIEITNLGNGKFKYLYIGNQLTPESTSSNTGVSYKQIINPGEYRKERDLERMREEAKNSPPDDTEMP